MIGPLQNRPWPQSPIVGLRVGSGMNLAAWYETYAELKWEFLRRNSDYQEDFDRLSASFPIPGHSFDDYLYCAAWNLSDEVEEEREAFCKKWNLKFPINYRHSYDEIPDYNVKWHIWYWARGDDPSAERYGPIDVTGEYEFLRDLWFDSSSWPDPDGTEDDWSRFVAQYKTSSELTLNIDLKYDKKIIIDGIKFWLSFVEKGKRFIRPDKPAARERQSFKLYPKYLKVWDLREKEELTFREIAEKIFPYDFEDPLSLPENAPPQEPEAKIDLVEYYYREAKRLVTHGI